MWRRGPAALAPARIPPGDRTHHQRFGRAGDAQGDAHEELGGAWRRGIEGGSISSCQPQRQARSRHGGIGGGAAGGGAGVPLTQLV